MISPNQSGILRDKKGIVSNWFIFIIVTVSTMLDMNVSIVWMAFEITFLLLWQVCQITQS